MQVPTCFDACEYYSCFDEVSFLYVKGFKMEQRATIEFCVKLKKAATETLKSAYVGECFSGTCV